MDQKLYAMALLGALGLAGCQTTAPMSHAGMDEVPAAGLTATQWKVSEIDGIKVPATYSAVLSFQGNGTLTGSMGCNNGSAQYKLSGHTFSISNMVSTKMSCDHLALESRLASALEATRHVQLTSTNGLELYDGTMKPRVTLTPRP